MYMLCALCVKHVMHVDTSVNIEIKESYWTQFELKREETTDKHRKMYP
jgi:hypothetical protein